MNPTQSALRGALMALFLVLLPNSGMAADKFAPYGSSEPSKATFKPAKMAYEWSGTPENAKANLQQLVAVLKVGQTLLPAGSRIEVVVIGGVIGVFAKENYETFQGAMDEIAQLTGPQAKIPVEITYCGTSLRGAGYKNDDMHGFGKVVPAGYLALNRLSQEGYSHAMVSDNKIRDSRYFFQPSLKPAGK